MITEHFFGIFHKLDDVFLYVINILDALRNIFLFLNVEIITFQTRFQLQNTNEFLLRT